MFIEVKRPPPCYTAFMSRSCELVFERNVYNLEFIDATEQEVHDLLKYIDTIIATGPDGISTELLHEAGAAIVPSLTQLIVFIYLQNAK